MPLTSPQGFVCGTSMSSEQSSSTAEPLLNDYILKSLHNDKLTPVRYRHVQRRLSQTGTNFIISYRGTFNPPHVGHLALLRHGFKRAGKDLNILCAIINPRDDDRVREKMRWKNETVALPKSTRASLWMKDRRFPPWARVFEGTDSEYTRFRESLISVTAKSGFTVSFINLAGPDVYQPKSPFPASSTSTLALVSNAIRPAYAWGTNTLLRLPGYSEWRRVLDRKQKTRTTRSKRANETDDNPQTGSNVATGESSSAVNQHACHLLNYRSCRNNSSDTCACRVTHRKTQVECVRM